MTLRAVPDDPDNPDDDSDDADVTSITDAEVSFTSAIYSLAIDKKTSGMLVTLLVMPESGVTNLHVLPLQRQRLQATLRPVRQSGGVTVPSATAQEDPVKVRMFAARMTRMMDGWTVGKLDAVPEC